LHLFFKIRKKNILDITKKKEIEENAHVNVGKQDSGGGGGSYVRRAVNSARGAPQQQQ
jgi:hypothetical protein